MQVRVVPVTSFQQNCSVLFCPETNKVAVVDPGGDLDVIKAAIKETGGELEKIFITHGHFDHAAATAELAADFGVPIEGPHKDEQDLISMMKQQAASFGASGAVGESFVPTRWLDDGDTVSFGNQTFDVVHCPGHTKGHVVFVHAKARFAIVGDVLFQGSIGRTDFPGGNHQDLVDSIRNKLFPLGDDIQFLPGHGPASTFGHERENNPFVGNHKVG